MLTTLQVLSDTPSYPPLPFPKYCNHRFLQLQLGSDWQELPADAAPPLSSQLPAVYGATGSQELTSILNAPEASSASTWLAWPFTAASSVPEVPPPLPPGTLPEVGEPVARLGLLPCA